MCDITFCIFDVGEPAYGPVTIKISNRDDEVLIAEAVQEILQDLHDSDEDPTRYYLNKKWNGLLTDGSIEMIAKQLFDNDCFVINEFQKWYSIAYVINFYPIKVYSRGSTPETKMKRYIDWNDWNKKAHESDWDENDYEF